MSDAENSMKKAKIYGILSYTAAVLLLLGCSLYFYDLFWLVGQKSFFTFDSDYLACFLPWNSQVNMYQGYPFSLFDLVSAFFGQFYRSWGVVAMPIVLGLLCAVFLSFAAKRWLLHTKRGQYPEKWWQRLVWWSLPLLGALLFMWAQLSFAFSKQGYDYKLKDYQFEHVLLKTERLMVEERYEEALQTANDYWFSHPCSIEDVISGQNTLYAKLSEAEITFRQDLSAFTRVAMLGSHRLNDDFFAYYRVPEIYGQIKLPLSAASITAMIHKSLLTGNHTTAYAQMMCLFETEGLSAPWIDVSIFSMLVCHQYALADLYIRLLEKTLFYRQKAQLYKETSRLLQAESTIASAEPVIASDSIPELVGMRPVASADPVVVSAEAQTLAKKIAEERLKIPTDYILLDNFDEENTRLMWQQSPNSLANLEYLCLFDMLRKNTDSVVARVDAYLRLSGQKPPYRLPSSWQEILLMYGVENRPLLPQVQDMLPHLKWDEFILRQSEAFFRARMRLRRREITPYDITRDFGHTFLYNYYYSRFVDAVSGASKSVSH